MQMKVIVIVQFIRLVHSLSEIIDIGYAFNENTVYWVGKMPLTVTKNATGSSTYIPYYASNDNVASEHGGTHLDAPFHFSKSGWKVADIPLMNLIIQGVLVDVKAEVNNNTEFLLQPQHLEDWQYEFGNITEPSVMLIDFGWAARWQNKTLYYGYSGTQCHFPGISKEAAQWIVENGNIVGVGVDTASVDVGVNSDYKVHQILSAANIYNLENVNLNNADIPAKGFDLIVMPMKIVEGIGAPCRVIAGPSKTTSAITYENPPVQNNTVILNKASYLSWNNIGMSIFITSLIFMFKFCFRLF